jgi:CRISPR/Cas system-associated exonuclease Cas4 (RecB family)
MGLNNLASFQFTQSNLQDYLDCKRRFLLKHVQRLSWPAIPSEPVLEYELFLQKGIIFHRLAYQFFIGIPSDSLKLIAENEGISDWWSSFLEYVNRKISKDAILLPERMIKIRREDHLVSVRYDLLVVEDDKIHIIDWKTSQQSFSLVNARQRIQTRLYLYALKQAGSILINTKPFKAEKISMSYWFAQFPENVVDISYDDLALKDDDQYFIQLISEIKAGKEGDFVMTQNQSRCSYCVYRSLCDRGREAGTGEDVFAIQDPDSSFLDLDFENIPEIAF